MIDGNLHKVTQISRNSKRIPPLPQYVFMGGA